MRAIHVHHGLSPNADAWARFCRKLCRRWKVPLTVRRVRVVEAGKGPEAAARAARYAVLMRSSFDVVYLAHHLDDQAETVLMNLLRGAGAAGARGMQAVSRLDGKTLVRPLLDVPRSAILAYATKHGLEWIEDESNADEALTRNFVRRRVGPLLDERFPGWRRALGRAAKHFARRELRAQDLLRDFLRRKGLKAPSEAKLVEMLRQLTSRGGARKTLEHDGARLRVYRDQVFLEKRTAEPSFRPVLWRGEARMTIPALGGELRFRRVRGKGIDARHRPLQVRLRAGGERLRPDARRPRRTLKNLLQEAGVPPWERDRLPLLYCGEELVWVPGVGVDTRYQPSPRSAGLMPEWRRTL